jgi:hypothetical protein
MRPNFVPNYLQTTEMAADAMISEGGAIQQPSMQDARAIRARLDKSCVHHSAFWHEWVQNPTAMFWTGFATGLAISLLDRASHPDPHA